MGEDVREQDPIPISSNNVPGSSATLRSAADDLPSNDDYQVTDDDDHSDDSGSPEEDDHSDVIPSSRMVTRASMGIYKPNPWFALTMAATKVLTPTSAKYAMTIPRWKEAMGAEFKALQENKTWTLVPRRSEDNVINTKWIFKVKSKPVGSIERYKAWLVLGSQRDAANPRLGLS